MERTRLGNIDPSLAAACLAAAVLFPIGAHLQTVGIYAAVADFETSLREASTALRVLLYLTLALVASRRPGLLDGRALTVAAAGCALTSFIALEMAIPSANVAFSAVGLACSGVATAWAGAQMALAFVRLPSVRTAALVIAAAMLFLFIALVWTGSKNFSFSDTIESVETPLADDAHSSAEESLAPAAQNAAESASGALVSEPFSRIALLRPSRSALALE